MPSPNPGRCQTATWHDVPCASFEQGTAKGRTSPLTPQFIITFPPFDTTVSTQGEAGSVAPRHSPAVLGCSPLSLCKDLVARRLLAGGRSSRPCSLGDGVLRRLITEPADAALQPAWLSYRHPAAGSKGFHGDLVRPPKRVLVGQYVGNTCPPGPVHTRNTREDLPETPVVAVSAEGRLEDARGQALARRNPTARHFHGQWQVENDPQERWLTRHTVQRRSAQNGQPDRQED